MESANMEREIRRCRSNLSILGSGVTVFTVWELIKPILAGLLVPQTVPASAAAMETPEAAFFLSLPRERLLAIVAGLLVFWVLNILLRFRIGRAARAEAAGKRRGPAYIIFAGMLLVIQALFVALTVASLFRFGLSERSILEAAATLLVEAGSMATLGELAFTAVKLKRLSRQAAG